MRFVDTRAVRPRWRFNLAYRISPRLQAGIEYNAAAGEWTPTANWIALVETNRQPMVSFGTSSDRIFSPPHKQAYYVSIAKTLPNLPIAPYVSLSYSEWERKLLVPFGCNFRLSDQWSLLGMNDGRNSHLLLTRSEHDFSISALWIKMRHPGISLSLAF